MDTPRTGLISHSNRSSRLSGTLLLALALGFGCGCSPVKKDKMATTLQDATNGYQSALRWGYYDNAYGYVDPKKREGKEMPKVLETIRLTGYDVVQPPVMKADSDTAMQIVTIEYLFEDKQVVKKLTDKQAWRYDEKAERWWLVSGLPEFK